MNAALERRLEALEVAVGIRPPPQLVIRVVRPEPAAEIPFPDDDGLPDFIEHAAPPTVVPLAAAEPTTAVIIELEPGEDMTTVMADLDVTAEELHRRISAGLVKIINPPAPAPTYRPPPAAPARAFNIAGGGLAPRNFPRGGRVL